MKDEELLRMQRDAIRRVREMQKRARSAVEEPPAAKEDVLPQPMEEAVMPPAPQHKVGTVFPGGLELQVPPDTLLLIGLILLLGHDRENLPILLALVYILM